MVRGAVYAFAVVLAGCGAAGGNADAGATDSGVVSCANDPRVQAYAPGMSVPDSAQDRTYVLQSADPAPPARGNNTWTVEVRDANGQALRNLSLDAAAFMPDHGHGSDVVPQVSSNGDGTYSVGPLYFFMPGVWRVTLSDADGGAASESGVYWFCIEG